MTPDRQIGRPHARYLELLARRLDERLADLERRELDAHLAECRQCRAVDREYRRQRNWLRGLDPVPPPRDLWARTASALDREVAGSARSPRRQQGSRPGTWLLAGTGVSLVAVVAILGIVGAYLLPVARDSGVPSSTALKPTPFQVPRDDLQIVTSDADGLSVVHADVHEVCPPDQTDCTSILPGREQQIPGSAVKVASAVSVNPEGDRIAVAGVDAAGDDVVTVVDLRPAGSPTDRPSHALPTPQTPAPSVASASATSPTPSPLVTASSLPTVSASPSDDAAVTASPSDAASESPITIASATPSASASASASSSPSASLPTPSSTPLPATPSATPSGTPLPTALQTYEATLPPGGDAGGARAILSHVLSAGAPPAWSSDGQVLAFSAMPANRSHGPDVYIWRSGDVEARAVTSDHMSYFASWAGSRIVISRTPRIAGAPDTQPIEPISAVLDPTTGEEHAFATPGLWLPVVDPTQRAVIFWRGFVSSEEPVTRVAEGQLLLGDWSMLDPFVPTHLQTAARAVADAPQVGPRTPSQRVVEWNARWTKDGAAFGLWTAERPHATTGRLTVVAVESSRGRPEARATLLDEGTAHRAFSLGAERAAWVVARPNGQREVRVGTWGASGSGTVRIETIGAPEAVSGF